MKSFTMTVFFTTNFTLHFSFSTFLDYIFDILVTKRKSLILLHLFKMCNFFFLIERVYNLFILFHASALTNTFDIFHHLCTIN